MIVKETFQGLNLSFVIERIRTDEEIDKKERIDRCSGLRTFSRCIGVDAALIPVQRFILDLRYDFLRPQEQICLQIGSGQSKLSSVSYLSMYLMGKV